jgi:propanol-preferring alcohol dehydrogenase
MKAMVLPRVVSLTDTDVPLELVELPTPQPQPGQLLLQVRACGVCHTELDEIEGRTVPPCLPIVLGHEVVGTVIECGAATHRFQIGDRVGVGWIHSSTGDRDENLSPQFKATGRDVNGGYAEYMTVPESYAYAIPEVFSDVEAAPLLCAGGIGYRALRLTNLRDGETLGLTGFGASAHLVLQLARHLFPRTRVFVFARDAIQREFALRLGADWAGAATDDPPEPLHAIIDTTPAWSPIVEALARLRPGGRLVINAIRKESPDQDCLLQLNYQQHLWMEKEIKSVANITHYDLQEFLPVAAAIPIKPDVKIFRLAQANEAIMELRRGGNIGALVLQQSTNYSESP